MSKNYLDLNGLTTYHNNITDLIDEQNEIIELTNAEYQALSTAEKNNGKYYHITDRAGTFSMDNKVTQTASDSSNGNYELLMSETADNTTRTEGARKGQYLTYNPSSKALTVGTRNSDYSVGSFSTVIGVGCAATYYDSIALGVGTRSSAEGAIAEGVSTYAVGTGSHAEGLGTRAQIDYQHVAGKYNVTDVNDRYAYIIGNGTADNARSDAFGIRWDGQLDVYNDIVRQDNNGTWDGTNTSLATAITSLNSKIAEYSHIEYRSQNVTFTSGQATVTHNLGKANHVIVIALGSLVPTTVTDIGNNSFTLRVAHVTTKDVADSAVATNYTGSFAIQYFLVY